MVNDHKVIEDILLVLLKIFFYLMLHGKKLKLDAVYKIRNIQQNVYIHH